MKLIRKGTFETNSSSTHALVVPHKVDNENWSLNDSLDHEYGFGRQESRLVEDWDEKLAYVYIVIKDFLEWNHNQEFDTAIDLKEFKRRVNDSYKKALDLVEYKPYNGDPKPDDIFRYVDSDGKEPLGDIHIMSLSDWTSTPYVDHIEDFASNGFLERILTDDEFLMKLLFNRDSYITIGGDEYRGYNIKTIGFEYDYKEGSHRMNEKGELPPKEWLDKRGCIKDEYWDRYWNEYTLETGEFWDKLREYEKDNDVFLKGN